MQNILKEGDFFQNLKVTRTNENFVFFDKKRISWKKINELINSGEKIIFKNSPDVDVDWTSSIKVKEYYNSFNRWSFYISNGCKYESALIEVKDGLAYYNGIYYLPFGGSHDDWCSKYSEIIEDGYYFVKLFKRGFGYYPTMPTKNYAYVFLMENKKPYTKQQIDDFERRNNYKFKTTYNNISKEDIEYIKTLDLRWVNSKELDFIKSYQSQIFADILPYKAKNGVYISKWENFNNPLSCNKGLLYIDNSYYGSLPHKFNYGVILRYSPSFSNEMIYCGYVSIKSISVEGLEKVSLIIEEKIKLFAKL